MHRAGRLMRRSSVRLKSLSGGHSHLLMVISQIREVRNTFKSFMTAQAVLSDDLSKWSCSIDNEAIRETFSYLGELSSLWIEVQKDFVDNLKHFRSNFDMILEGERHVDHAKQTYTSREEAEKDARKELQKAYKKSPTEEIQSLREKLNKSEKFKELAHLEVVDRIRENEAIRMIRVKEGMKKYGESFSEMIHKANYVFNSQQKIVAEVPDVHDKALHGMKYRGHVCSSFVQEAKDLTRLYRRPSASSEIEENKCEFSDPPPPYTLSADSPSRDEMNSLSRHLSNTSLRDADRSSSRTPPTALVPFGLSTSNGIYQTLQSPQQNNNVPPAVAGATAASFHTDETEFNTILPRNPPGTKPALFPLKAARLKRKKSGSSSPFNDPSSPLDLSRNGGYLRPSDEAGGNNTPPYNPFYEWSSFPPSDD